MKKLFILLSLCLVVGSARAKVTLPAIFTDNMVLQQKHKLPSTEKLPPVRK